MLTTSRQDIPKILLKRVSNETLSDNSLPETVSPVTSTTDDTAEPELVIFNETKQNEMTP